MAFACQIIFTAQAATPGNANEQHMLGAQISHHHAHDSHDTDVNEHEELGHEHHCHTTCHPPIETSFIANFYQDATSLELSIEHQSIGLAPPNPPPSV